MSNHSIYDLGIRFAQILNGKPSIQLHGCSVTLKRNWQVKVQGRLSESVTPVGVSFEALDEKGNSLNLAEVTVIQHEIPHFIRSVVEQGLIVSALHNHWIFTEPNLMYVHIQSVEPPLDFAQKMANAFETLSSPPVKGS
ncbi:DUF1259 domain-containing protein [Pullulanibacillus sp. KACC 23026]|uniref:DUF1259 domain-containing protein n=1 Tax=Pullulanibacillus sp. KACC 23026 TaxID=3028315 RepID=UPI0023B08938|nr:DUF1259 domain-containing protein [Pullulanibacillus sp. KACC 23026]WEG14569.1 DUF1259 domain-containing protein [Pullulanibacillus sp. KACC 23026]